jgi:prepilin-type N-terminal cleavage/methylation domain-containing protein
MRRQHPSAFTLIELLVVISIIALLIAILLPVLGEAQRQARITQNATHQRGIHQAFAMFAETNDGYFPGIDRDGPANTGLLLASKGGQITNSARKSGDWPAARFALIVDQEYVSPDYVINPADIAPREAWSYGKNGRDSYNTSFDWHNFSYAVEEWSGGFLRRQRFKIAEASIDRMSSETISVADRIVVVQGQDYDNIDQYIGVFSKGPGQFSMGLAWGDGHTTFQNTPIVDTKYGRYRNTNDNIYQRDEVDSSVSTSPAPPNNANVSSKVAYLNPDTHQSHISERP